MMNTSHILVVDDDFDVCEVVRQLLESNDFRVSIAHDGRAMRQILGEDGVDLVILDAALPGESGASLALYAQELGLRVIMMTGDPGQQDSVEVSGLPFIFKPFRITELLRLVIETLHSASSS